MAERGDAECIAIIEMDVQYPDAVLNAIEPDNRDSPPHVKVNCRVAGGLLICTIMVWGCSSNPSRILTLRNTIDDLTSAVKTALESIEHASRSKSYKSG